MFLCGDGHEEICCENIVCPMCETISFKDKEISELVDKVSELEDEITYLQKEA